MRSLTSHAVSVRGRLTIAVTVLFAAVVFFGSWFLLNRAEAAWVDDLQAQDIAELEQLAADLTIIESTYPGFGTSTFPLPVGADGTTFTLVDSAGVILGTTPVEVFSTGAIIPIIPPGADPETIIELGSGVIIGPDFGAIAPATPGEMVTVSVPVELQNGTLTLVASSSLAPIQAGVDALGNTLRIVVPLLIAAVAVLAWTVTGRAFRPVEAITNQVERITDDRLDERVPVPNSRDEVAHLASTMNRMLDRLSASRSRQREFVSDASHELRNPVATSKAKLEVGLAHSEHTDWERTAEIVLEEQDRLGRLIDDLLLLARLDESPEPSTRADVDVDDIIYTETSRPQPTPIDISGVEPARIQGDRHQLTRLVRNLIDNATSYATNQVTVTLQNNSDHILLAIEDDGPGIPKDDRERVLERFVRTDHARTRTEGGTGLGLAIVNAVAAAHQGSVTITEAAIGGTRAEVRLPNTPSLASR